MNVWFDFWLYFSRPYTGDFSYFHHGILFKEEEKNKAHLTFHLQKAKKYIVFFKLMWANATEETSLVLDHLSLTFLILCNVGLCRPVSSGNVRN